MAKLESIQGGLANIKKRLEGQVESNMDGLSTEIRTLTHAVQVVMGALSNRDKNDSFTQSEIKRLAKAVNVLGRELKSMNDFAQRLGRIETDLKTVPREFPLPKDVVIPDNAEAFKSIQASIKGIKFPRSKDTDLQPLTDLMLAVIEKQNEIPKQVLIPARKNKHIFTIERDEQDLITRVVVT